MRGLLREESGRRSGVWRIRVAVVAGFSVLGTACEREKQWVGGATVHLEAGADGRVYEKGKGEPFTGVVTHVNERHVRVREESYVDGVPWGEWREWWPGGRRLKESVTWVNGSRVRERRWYSDGSRRSDSEMKDGTVNGWVRMWWPDGRLHRQAYLEDGMQVHGHLLEYDEDGAVLWDAIFEHGEFRSGMMPKELANVVPGGG